MLTYQRRNSELATLHDSERTGHLHVKSKELTCTGDVVQTRTMGKACGIVVDNYLKHCDDNFRMGLFKQNVRST